MTTTEAEQLKQQADEAAGFATPEAVEEVKTVQKPRHVAKNALYMALSHLQGRVGISPDTQIALLKDALAATYEAQNAIHEAIELAGERDFEAHQARKAEESAAQTVNVVGIDDTDNEEDEDGE
jgi:hypothetical protein